MYAIELKPSAVRDIKALPHSERGVILSASALILSAAKNLARTGTPAKILACAQNDWPSQDFRHAPLLSAAAATTANTPAAGW